MKITALTFFIVALLLTRTTSHAQAPAIEWQKCLGSNFSDYAHCVQPTSDGGFIVSGYSVGADNGDVMGHHGNYTVGDIWVVKLDKSGNIEWQKNLGGTDSEYLGFILQTADGGYILAGGAASTGCEVTGNHGAFDFWVVKLDSKGDMSWQKMYGGSSPDIAYSIAQDPAGGYFVAGFTQSNDGDVNGAHGELDYWVIKIDAAGKLLWQKALGGTGYDYARSIQATGDGGCIVAGTSEAGGGDVSGHHGYGDFWLVKLDNKGSIQWQKALGGSMSEEANAVLVTSDGNYIVAGHSNSIDGDVTGVPGRPYNAWIVKLDKEGKVIWQKSYGGSVLETAKFIQNTPDGGYVFTGGSYSSDGNITCNAGFYDVLVMKINSGGVLQWQKTMGGAGFDEGYCVQALKDGSFIVAGCTESADVAGYHTPIGGIYDDKSDYWVIKLTAPLSAPPAPVVTIDPASAIVCAGKPATIRATVRYGGVNPIYKWMKNGVAVGTNSSSYTDTSLNENDQVSCVVNYGNKCEDPVLEGSDVVTIKLKKVAQNPAIVITADNIAACNCNTITIKASISNGGGSPIYRWMINGNETGSNAPLMISVKLKDGDVITCSYIDNTSCDGAVLSNAIKIGGGEATVPSVSIVVAADTICQGATAIFTATAVNAGNNPTYQWKVNNVNTGTNSSVFSSTTLIEGAVVSCSVTTDPLSTCTPGTGANSNSIVLHVTGKLTPLLNVAASAESICSGSPVTFTATATSAGLNPAYQWKINGVNTGTNSSVYANSLLKDKDIVNCVLSIDPVYTCALTKEVTSKNIVITVSAGTPPSVEIRADKNNVCAGELITFTAVATNAGSNPVFQWSLNNVVLQNNLPVYTSTKLENGDRLFCRLMPGAGACSDAPDTSNIIVAAIKQLPEIYLSPVDTTIAIGMQVQFRSRITGNISSFEWSPADKLIDPLSLNPQTTILNETTTYKLAATNDQGCSATAMAVVKIGTTLYMPKAFTPNNDGVNDLFRIPPAALLELKEFTVYDRWGNKAFSTTNKSVGWNGMVNGSSQNSGVYIYYIKGIINSKEVFLRGSFMLVK